MNPNERPLNIPLLRRLLLAEENSLDPIALGPGSAAALEDLSAFGFPFIRDAQGNVVRLGPAPRLCPDQIEWELGTTRIGRRIAVWNRVTSTNDFAARAATSTANDGLVILAEEQTAGRGRRGRSWRAPRQSAILMSVLSFPPQTLDDPGWLTAWGAVAVAEVVEAWTNRPARIKWPNDVRVDGRKVAGILVERGVGAVVGIGLNVSTRIEDFPSEWRDSATSLALLDPRLTPIDRSELVRALIRGLDTHLMAGLERGPDVLNDAWRDRLERLGEVVRIETPEGPLRGRLVEAHIGQGMLLKIENGPERRLAAAEVLAMSQPEPA